MSQHPLSQQAQVNAAGNLTGAAKRRSTRIERSIPLIVLGKSQTGEPFMERTAAATLSKHGCRYPSRFDYGVGTAVTLQLMGAIGDDKPQMVRAVVRSVHPPASLRELQQVGVELEIPANVWGIEPAPADWTVETKADATTTQAPGLAGPATSSPKLETKNGELNKTTNQDFQPKQREFADPALAAQPRPAAPAQAKRAVVTPDELIAALQGKLQQEAEKAVQTAFAKQVNDRMQDALRDALRSLDDARVANTRKLQELVSAEIAEVRRSLKEEAAAQLATQRKEIETSRGRLEEIGQRLEAQAGELRRELAKTAREYTEKMTEEIGTQIPARLAEAVGQATLNFESATAAVVEQRYAQLLNDAQSATQEMLTNLNSRWAEMQAVAQSAVHSGLEEFRREAERHSQKAVAETQERAMTALASLDAQSRAAWDARRQALEADVSHSGELAVDEFRKGMRAFLYSCLVAAVDAVDEHSKTTLQEMRKASEGPRVRPMADSEDEAVPNAGGDLLTH